MTVADRAGVSVALAEEEDARRGAPHPPRHSARLARPPAPLSVDLVLTVGLVALALVETRRRLHGLAGPWTAPAEALLAVTICAVSLSERGRRSLTVTWNRRRGAISGLAAVVVGTATLLAVGQDHPVIVAGGFLLLLLGVGMVVLPSASLREALPLVLPVGIVSTALTSMVVGELLGLTRATSFLVPGIAVLVGVGQLVVRRGSPSRTVQVHAAQWLLVGLALVALCTLGTGITVLPYKLLHPVVPFGRDMQHQSNIHHIITTGRAQHESYTIHQFYPDTFSYWASYLGLQTGIGAIRLLMVLGPLSWLLVALVVFGIGADFFGARAGILALAAFSIATYQPRSTLLDGAYIAIVAEYVLAPAALYALYRCLRRPSNRSLAAFALLAGGLIQFHLVGFSRFFIVGVAFLVVACLTNASARRVLGKVCLAALVGGAIGAPYTWRFAWIYLQSVWKEGGQGTSIAVFPSVPFPSGFEGLLGTAFFGLIGAATCLWMTVGYRVVADRRRWLLISCWLWVTLVLVFTKLLLIPERDLRSGVLPACLIIGWAVNWLAEAISVSAAPLLAAAAIAASAAFLAPAAVQHTTAIGRIEVYATGPEMRFMASLDLPRLPGLIGTDESGVWLPYFGRVDNQVIAAAGGYAGFRWYGEPLRHQYTVLYGALHDPCGSRVADRLHGIGVDFVYLGPPPAHWTLPGYTYTAPGTLLACPANFSLVKADRALGSYFFAVR